jgi:hypothetical protein
MNASLRVTTENRERSTLKRSLILLGTSACLFFATAAVQSARAEEITVPIGQQAQGKRSMDRPATGMSQNQVRSYFGEPLSWKSPVGDPPISRWEYEDFVVYFEYDHVVHTVLKYSGENNANVNARAATVLPQLEGEDEDL